MSTPEETRSHRLLAELIDSEKRFAHRLRGVFRLDPGTYREIAEDSSAIPQAFTVVMATAVIVGIGSGSIAMFFLGVAWTIFVWLMVAALVWSAGTLTVGSSVDYGPLLRCLGFAYAWFALFIGSALPWIGFLFGWAAVLLCLVSNVLATREVLQVSTERAAGICALALGAPLLLLWLAF